MRVQLKSGVSTMKAKSRLYDPVKGALFGGIHGGCSGVRACVPKLASGIVEPGHGCAQRGDTFRMVSDYKAVDAQVEKSPGVIPNDEFDMSDLLGARFVWGSWSSSKAIGSRIWQKRLNSFSSIRTLCGLFVLLRVPGGLLKATAYFRGVMTELLDRLKC